jgi:hypothetical protein
MRALRFAILFLAVTAGCLPGGAGAFPGELPAPGVYPGDSPNADERPRVARDEAWTPAAGYLAALDLPGSLSSVVAAPPPSGSPVAVRTFAWPAPLEVRAFGADGIHLAGVPVPASRLAGEIRCLGLPAGAPISLSARIVNGPRAVRVESRIETPPMVTCDISWSGRKRLEAVTTDVWMWSRELAARGSVLPAVP